MVPAFAMVTVVPAAVSWSSDNTRRREAACTGLECKWGLLVRVSRRRVPVRGTIESRLTKGDDSGMVVVKG